MHEIPFKGKILHLMFNKLRRGKTIRKLIYEFAIKSQNKLGNYQWKIL